VVITGILLAIVQPRFVGVLQRDRLRRSANKLATDIRLAQNEAIRRQKSTTVGFNVEYDAYRVAGLAPETDGSTTFEVHLGADRTYQTGIVSAEFGHRLDLTFDGFGAPSAGGKIELGVQQLRVTLEVSAGTGRVTVGELQRCPDALPTPVDILPAGIEYGGQIDPGGGLLEPDPISTELLDGGSGGEIEVKSP
jgi:Tfp pilus assembly protein FimT